MAKTAVGAPAPEPFEDLFTVLDQMEMVQLLEFVQAIGKRYGLALAKSDSSLKTTTLSSGWTKNTDLSANIVIDP